MPPALSDTSCTTPPVGVAKASRYIQGSSELAVVSFICSVSITFSEMSLLSCSTHRLLAGLTSSFL